MFPGDEEQIYLLFSFSEPLRPGFSQAPPACHKYRKNIESKSLSPDLANVQNIQNIPNKVSFPQIWQLGILNRSVGDGWPSAKIVGGEKGEQEFHARLHGMLPCIQEEQLHIFIFMLQLQAVFIVHPQSLSCVSLSIF